jgi:hypothetical protein
VLRLIGGPHSNRSGFHAWVEAQGLGLNAVREVVGGGSYQSASDRRLHIGCGAHRTIPRLLVHWPSGLVQTFDQVNAGAYVLREGDAALTNR